MRLVQQIVERLALAVLLIGGLGMLMSVFLGTMDVVGTQAFGVPIAGARELTESTMVLIVFGALTYAQIRRSHIRVELIYSHASPRMRAMMDVLADVAALVFFGLLLWQAIGEARFSLQIGEVTDGLISFPLTPARIILATGTALMVVRLGLDLVLDMQRVASGENEDGEDDGGSMVANIPQIDIPKSDVK